MSTSPLKIQTSFASSKSLDQRANESLQNQSEFEIWNAFRDGHEGAFVHIYKAYANMLYNYGCKLSTDQEMVRDCLQDLFIYLRNHRENLSATTSIKLYLFKSFRRRMIDYINKNTSEKKKAIAMTEFMISIEDSSDFRFIKEQNDERNNAKLDRALASLSDVEREAVHYFYYEGLGYKEVAELLGVTHVASARRIIYRAISHLKSVF